MEAIGIEEVLATDYAYNVNRSTCLLPVPYGLLC